MSCNLGLLTDVTSDDTIKLMRDFLSKERLYAVLNALANACRGPGSVFLCGGATAVDFGFRLQTIDLDLKLDPEPRDFFSAVAKIKEEFQVNIELACPDNFIPPLPGWKERSIPIVTQNEVRFFHYDPLSQVLAKIERGHEQDLKDAKDLLRKCGIAPEGLPKAFASIESELPRYPAVDPECFARQIDDFISRLK